MELPSHFPEEVRHMSTFVVACVPTFSLPCFHVRGKLIRQTNLAHQIQTYYHEARTFPGGVLIIFSSNPFQRS